MSILSMPGSVPSRVVVACRRRIQVPAAFAGAVLARGVEAIEHRREILLDVAQGEEFLVQLVVAVLAVPQQAVLLVRQALAFDHQADRAGHALRRVRHARRQVEGLAGADRDVAHGAVLLDAQDHFAFELMEPLRAFVPVVVGALVGPADRHDDEVAVDDALVADRRLEQVAMFLDPGLEIDRIGQAHAGSFGTTAMHLSSMSIGVGRALMPTVVRQGACAASGKCSAQTAFQPLKSRAMSVRNTVTSTRSSQRAPLASSTARTLASTARDCASMPCGMASVPGARGPIPDRNSSSPTRRACG